MFKINNYKCCVGWLQWAALVGVLHVAVAGPVPVVAATGGLVGGSTAEPG